MSLSTCTHGSNSWFQNASRSNASPLRPAFCQRRPSSPLQPLTPITLYRQPPANQTLAIHDTGTLERSLLDPGAAFESRDLGVDVRRADFLRKFSHLLIAGDRAEEVAVTLERRRAHTKIAKH
jgi:hypothetical protein